MGAARPAGSDTIRIGLVGCGNRGSRACRDALSTAAAVWLVAMGDLFPARLEASLKDLLKTTSCGRGSMYRPSAGLLAVQAGRQVFLEKPCCVDAPGYRQLLAANRVAKAKGLSVVVGAGQQDGLDDGGVSAEHPVQ